MDCCDDWINRDDVCEYTGTRSFIITQHRVLYPVQCLSEYKTRVENHSEGSTDEAYEEEIRRIILMVARW